MHSKSKQYTLKTTLGMFAPDLQPFYRKLLAAYILSLVSIVALVFSPWPLKMIIDQVISHQPFPGWWERLHLNLTATGMVIAFTGAFVVLMAVAALCGAASKLLIARVRESFTLRLRDRVLAHVQLLSPANRLAYKSGELVMRLVGDVTLTARLFSKTLPVIFRHVVTMLFTLSLMFWIQWHLALLSLLVIPGLLLLMRHYGKALKKASRRKRHFEGEAAGLAQEIITGLATIQALGEENHSRRQFRLQNEQSLHAGVHNTRVAVSMERAMQMAQALAIGLITGGGAFLVLKNLLTIGELTVFAAYMTQLLKPVEKINELVSAVTRGVVAMEKLRELLSRKPHLQQAANAVTLRETRGRFELQNVWFAYPGEEEHRQFVLQGIDVVVPGNQFTVLSGHSGCGKSTLLSLLLHLYEPTRGQILLDGTPLQHITTASLRSQISVMLQTTHLFAGRLREALVGNAGNIQDRQIWEALAFVAMEEHVAGLPQGLDSSLGEDGLNLSGGQRKRLSLARAFLHDRPIFLLDEPLANVDPESCDIILSALETLRQRKTCVVISHRAEMLRLADVVYKLEAGKMYEQPPCEGYPLPAPQMYRIFSGEGS